MLAPAGFLESHTNGADTRCRTTAYLVGHAAAPPETCPMPLQVVVRLRFKTL